MSNRIETLRNRMMDKGIGAYVVPLTDAHNSEYVSNYDQLLQFFTGFSGSNGTLVVTKDIAYVWTDGRYFIQCEKEIAGKGIQMMKMGEEGVPTVWEYLADLTEKEGQLTLGFDGSLITASQVKELKKNIKSGELTIFDDINFAGAIWDEEGNRPKKSCERVKILDLGFAGVSSYEKVEALRDKMEDLEVKQVFISKLDDIMWLFNLRGSDVTCNPVALSYAFVGESECFLFLQRDAVSEAVRAYLANQRVILCDYEDVYDFIKEYPYEGKILIDDKEVNYLAYMAIVNGAGEDKIVNASNPVMAMKAIKNETEIKNMKEYFLRDSVAMTKYLYWLKNLAFEEGELTEMSAAKKCDELRSQVSGFIGLSFPTICSYGSNGAMIHYEPTEDDFAVCERKGMLLTDCGGQYPGATTDVTRTVALGPVTEEEKTAFTYVLKGFLSLMNATWLAGCTGRNLDIISRSALWSHGMDYKHGTGHGVGCYLNVHEGPQNIRWKYIKGAEETELKPGMAVTDEPGMYVEDKYGIRTENTLLVSEKETTEYGQFLCFESLTWVPIDMDLVDKKLLNSDEEKWLKDYQKKCLEKLKDFLDEDEAKWLKSIC